MLYKNAMYIRLAVFSVLILFILIALLLLQFNTSVLNTTQTSTNVPQPTSSTPVFKPYVNTLLTPPPFDTVTLTFTAEGVSVDGDTTKVTVDDVISIINQDTKKHSVRIQDKELTLEPGSAHGYPVSATNDAKITVVLDGNTKNAYIYEIQ